MKGFCLIFLLVLSIFCDSEDKFLYLTQDYLQIEQSSSMQIELALSSKANQYMSEAQLQVTLIITQNTSLFYNILYFNNQNANGHQCYQNWIQNHQVQDATACRSLNQATVDSMPDCMNYTNCINQNISFALRLSDDLFRQNYIVLQNNNNVVVGITTKMKIELDSQNWWFYWGVGLTCLLMISLVIFSGIVFYWSLKYKKMKKMFDQYKLTQDSQTVKND